MTTAGQRQSNTAFSTFLSAVSGLVKSDRLKETLCAIQASDRLSTFSAYNRTAQFVQGCFAKMGLDEVERVDLSADGKAVVGDWVMPLAWDAEEGVLELVGEDGEVREELARYTKIPDQLILGSTPTGPEGVTAELCLLKKGSTIDQAFRGRIALVDVLPCSVKLALHDAGALGLVSFYHPASREDPQSIYWNNSWSDREGGWWATAGDCRFWGFSISPASGQRLVDRLKSGERLFARAVVKSRLYEGTWPWISGLLRGATHPEEEVLVLGHLYERGAHDNASGCAAILEIARAISEGIASGVLKRPARSLRFLLVPECYGPMAYLERCRDRLARTVAAVNLDGFGAGWPFEILRGPDAAQSLLGPILLETAKATWPERPESDFIEGEYDVCDTLIGDPLFGALAVWPHRRSLRKIWHTTMDEPERMDFEALRETSACVGAFLLEMADFGLKKLEELISLSERRLTGRLDEMLQRREFGCYLEYEIAAAARVLRQAERFFLPEDRKAAAGKLDRAAKDLELQFHRFILASPIHQDPKLSLDRPDDPRVFRRTLAGVPSLDTLPDREFAGLEFLPPRWLKSVLCGFWRLDGRRSLSEVERLVSLEMKKPTLIWGYVELFHKLGYVEEVKV